MESSPVEINVFHGTGEHAHLSNFAVRPFPWTIRGVARQFQTVEGAFQASKLEHIKDSADAEGVIRELADSSGARARQIGRGFRGLDVAAWDRVSESLMFRLVLESFVHNPEARQGLMATGNAKLTHRKEGVEQDGGRFARVLTEVREALRG